MPGRAITCPALRATEPYAEIQRSEVERMLHRLILHAGLVAWLAVSATGCEHKSSGAPKKESPANVPNIPKEEKLNEFELTPAAEERLGIVTTPLEKRPTVPMRMYGGEIALPTRASPVVTAPFAGVLES